MDEMPCGYVAAVILHPGIWWGHGPRQVLGWFSEARRRGLRVLAPGSPWLGLLVAADTVIGDPGSMTAYAAGLGAAPLLAGGISDIAPGSTPELLHRIARHYQETVPIWRQIEEASARWGSEQALRVHSRLTSEPGRSARLLRQVMYQLMDLPEPGQPARLEPLRFPEFVTADSLRGLSAEGRVA
ncbi:hypothetical protein KGD82_24955 [Nocardiopsis eucommiae]|uniref:Uncharacterized protein n=1 Tax=Nocardiopsis eucommiae TaxID=2831970 RepID=A0A975QJ62_9ACTN|nr:hypothetical protein KGD82_24955 [Nocardiopsis eucommiae]